MIWTEAKNYAAANNRLLPTQEELRQSGVRPERGIGQDEWHPVRREDGIEYDWANIGTWGGNSDYISHLDHPSIGYVPLWGMSESEGGNYNGGTYSWTQDKILYTVVGVTN